MVEKGYEKNVNSKTLLHEYSREACRSCWGL